MRKEGGKPGKVPKLDLRLFALGWCIISAVDREWEKGGPLSGDLDLLDADWTFAGAA